MQRKTDNAVRRPIELIPIDDGQTRANKASPRSLIALARQHRSFVLAVVLPTVLAAINFYALAAPRYESESKFVVRSPSNTVTSQLASLMQGSSTIRSADDAYIVHAYLRSRDAVRQLQRHNDLVQRLNAPQIDIWWHYPGPFLTHNEERLWRHVQRFVDLEYDQTTGISTLRVQGFSPEDARTVADVLLRDAEALINRLSERAQGDAIRAAEREVELSRARAREAQAQVTEFRTKESIVDPSRVSTAALEIITRLALEMAQTNAQLSETVKASPQSPTIATLRTRIAALDNQILQERQQLAGGDSSLAPRIAAYERLMLEREFAERTFASALTSLEVARVDAQRQRLFLERISSPQAPDYATYPYRFWNTLGVFALCWALWSIGRRLVADTRAHAGM